MTKGNPLKDVLDLIGNYELNVIILQALRFFLRNPYESIVIVDKDAKIQFIDRASEEYFGIAQGGAKGKDITSLMPLSLLPLTLETGMPIIGRLYQLKYGKRISTNYPLKKDGQIIGAIGKIIFNSLEEMERINSAIQEMKREINYFKQREQKEYASVYTFDQILGTSSLIRNAVETSKKISLLNTDVLIIGESGTGKELFAHSIHSCARSSAPFVKVNCPAIPFELAESELFGYEKGAFTGALSSGKAGHFEMANNGTIYLDEISSLPLSIQAKLLRVLEEREVGRLGSTKTKKIDFRIICATNIDLKQMVKEGKFRDDLYYRVAKATIHVPPLRDRRDDIPVYVQHFIKRIDKSFNRQVHTISDRAMDVLLRYDWPGNVRELINVLEQTAVEAFNTDQISEKHLPDDVRTYVRKIHTLPENKQITSIRHEITRQEKEIIISALKKVNGNKRKAAQLLDMPRSSLYQKLRRYKINET